MSYEDFGRYLGQQRELRGLSRDELSQITKIPPSMLEALELGMIERLPERVFVRNIVRSYAGQLGLEEAEVMLRFQEAESQAQGDGLVGARALKRKGALGPQIWIVVAVAALLLGALGATLAWTSREGPQVAAPARP